MNAGRRLRCPAELPGLRGDKLADGRVFRILTVVDQFSRECVWLEADYSMNGVKVAAALTRATAEREGSRESVITCDNGSEFASRIMEAWAMEHEVKFCFIRPGRPVENGFAGKLQRSPSR